MTSERMIQLFCYLWPILLGMVGCVADDTEEIPIEPYYVLHKDESPTWSPDGLEIVYWHFNPDLDDQNYPTGLYIVNLATGNRRLVLLGNAWDPDWSPDGSRIAFASGDIFTVKPDGSDLRRLTTQGSVHLPDWSPEGKQIAYDATKSPPDSMGIWIMNADGTGRRHLGLGRNPAWSPDGAMLAYEGPPERDEENQIWSADTNGNNRKQITHSASVANRWPTWSPDGKWIAWEGEEIWIVGTNAANPYRLTAGAYPAWSPDGKKLAFSALDLEQKKSTIWTIGPDGSDLKQITF